MAITRGTLRLVRQHRAAIGAEADAVDRTLAGRWVAAWDRLARPWSAAADDLVALAFRLERWPTRNEIARTDTVIAALTATEQALDRLAEQAGGDAAAGAERVIRADPGWEARIIASQAPAGEQEALARRIVGATAAAEQTGINLHQVAPGAVDAIVFRTQGRIHADTWPLSADAVDSMRRGLVRGIRVGDNPRQAAHRIVADTEGLFNGGLARATTIARTEMLDAYRTSAAWTHQTNRDVVPAWEWWAELDDLACVACWGMHGTVHPVSDPGPDDHPRGRCTRLPILSSWEELGIKAPEPPSVTVDAEGLFRSLPLATQLRIMGPARQALWQSGRIGWADLSMQRSNPGWRPSRVPRPVRDLERLAAASTPSG